MDPSLIYPKYAAWLEVYEAVKEYCSFAEAVEFIKKYPETVNNRKGGEGGWTLLHQAAFWGVDRGVLDQFRLTGANPCLLDRNGHSPLRCTQSAQFQTDFLAVFGDPENVRPTEAVREILDTASIDDNRFKEAAGQLTNSELRQAFVESCKYGDFAISIRLLILFPFLCNSQSVTGWSALHQACFHGVGRGVFTRLRQLGVSGSLLTSRGEDAGMIVEQYHPGTNVPNDFAEVYGDSGEVEGKVIEIGQLVHLATANACGNILGKVEDIDSEERTVRIITASGEEHRGPFWRVSVLKSEDQDISEQQLTKIMHECCVCGQPTLLHHISPRCAEAADHHPMCPECCVNSLWSAFTGGALPPVCTICRGPVDLLALRTRIFLQVWARRHPTIPYNAFIANVEEKLACISAGPVTWETLDSETRTQLEAEIAAGNLMRCMGPGCGQPFNKLSGCNWVKCLYCAAENCWATKKLAGLGEGRCGGGHACHY